MVLLEPKKRIIVMENEFDRILRKVRQESLDEGIDIGRNEIVKSLIASGALPLSKVAEYSGLTLLRL